MASLSVAGFCLASLALASLSPLTYGQTTVGLLDSNTTDVFKAEVAESSESPIEVEFDVPANGTTKSFMDRFGLRRLQQRIEQAIRATGQKWRELKPRFVELGNELKGLMSNRTAIVETIQRFANRTGILVRIRDKMTGDDGGGG